MSKEETGGQQGQDTEQPTQASEYDKFRAAEYSQLRSRFYRKYPINHESDWSFEDKLFDKLDVLEFNLKTEELAHQETLKAWRKLQKSLR